eukprot:6379259-Lingulodinium_polyedra.AAC.1
MARAWELEHKSKHLLYQKGSSCVMAVWRVAVLAEYHAAGGAHVCSLSWDLYNFFEFINRKKLAAKEKRLEMPQVLTRIPLGMYAAPRVVQLNGWAKEVGCPTRGIIAGCGLATTHTQAYSLEDLQALAAANPRVDI